MGYSNLLAELRQIGEPTVLRKRTHIAFQGEVPRYAYYLLDGAVKAYVISADSASSLAEPISQDSSVLLRDAS
jgi:CRP-like cAMP-binding protein